jgi:hypothetical protein
MPPKENVWGNSALLLELVFALHEVGKTKGAWTTDTKAAVQNYLKEAGHEVTWEAIR